MRSRNPSKSPPTLGLNIRVSGRAVVPPLHISIFPLTRISVPWTPSVHYSKGGWGRLCADWRVARRVARSGSSNCIEDKRIDASFPRCVIAQKSRNRVPAKNSVSVSFEFTYASRAVAGKFLGASLRRVAGRPRGGR